MPQNNPDSHNAPRRHLPVNLVLVENRIRVFMEHSTRYAFMGSVRLSKDCGVSDAAICRLLTGYGSPSYAMIVRLTQAFEKEFKQAIDPRDVAAIDGAFLTPTVCEVVGCKGCTPQAAWNDDDTLKTEYAEKAGSRSRKIRP